MNDALYNGPSDGIDFDLVRQFVLDAEEANLFSESLTFEAKERRDRNNVVEAVAALSNTDGGIVLVGVKDKDASGDRRIVGVPRAEHDRLVSSCMTSSRLPCRKSFRFGSLKLTG